MLLPGQIRIKGSRRLLSQALRAHGVLTAQELPETALATCLKYTASVEVSEQLPGWAEAWQRYFSHSRPVRIPGTRLAIPDEPAFLAELVRRGVDLTTFELTAQLSALAPKVHQPRKSRIRKEALTLCWSHEEHDTTPDMCVTWARPFNKRDCNFLLGSWQHILDEPFADACVGMASFVRQLGLEPSSVRLYARADKTHPRFDET